MSTSPSWTTPEDIKLQLVRSWDRGRILGARLTGESLFPMPLRLTRPDTRALSDRFHEVRQWIRALEQGSKTERGFGYEIEWAVQNHRQLGKNRVPASLVIPTEEDALQLLGKRRHTQQFQSLADATRSSFPELGDWLARRPLILLEHADNWPRVLAVLSFLRANPRPGLYLRQLDIPDVDTKFIETHKGLFAELLEKVVPPAGPHDGTTAIKDFERRYGLLTKPPLVRFRILDPRDYIRGLSDIATPAAQFALLALPVERVFITENDVNGLSFPDVAHSLVIFGLGYGLERLAEIGWLKERTLYYWDDIDTHGYAILDRLRASLPGITSLLMDRETLMAHRRLWTREEVPHVGPLTRLTAAERAVFEDLSTNALGEQVRLEQERISFGSVKRALANLPGLSV